MTTTNTFITLPGQGSLFGRALAHAHTAISGKLHVPGTGTCYLEGVWDRSQPKYEVNIKAPGTYQVIGTLTMNKRAEGATTAEGEFKIKGMRKPTKVLATLKDHYVRLAIAGVVSTSPSLGGL